MKDSWLPCDDNATNAGTNETVNLPNPPPRDDVVVDCKCGRTSGGFHPPRFQPETIRSGYWLLLILICHDCCPHKQHMASQLTRDIFTYIDIYTLHCTYSYSRSRNLNIKNR